MIKYFEPIVIAEVGCNHMGDFNLAKKMIQEAAKCGADYVKFQKRNNKYLLGGNFDVPHPVPENSYGNTYGKHRDFLEFSINQHKQLAKYCQKNNIKYSTSVWEIKSAEEVVKSKIKMDFIKIPSACNLDFELLKYILCNFKEKIHLSTGMTKISELKIILKMFRKYKRLNDLVLYVCTSDYPVKDEDICLLEIKRIKSEYKLKKHQIGFSGHHLGIAVDLVAYTLGAKFIERHFTLDRTFKGTDHAASLEPNGLQNLKRDLISAYMSLKFKTSSGLLKNEMFQRKKLKRIKI